VLLNQHGQVLAEAVVAVTLAVADASEALPVAAPVRRQLFTVAVSKERRLSEVHTFPVEVSAGRVWRLDFTLAALGCLQ